MTELGVVAGRQSDFARATELLAQATVLAQEDGDRRQLAYLAAHQGDVDIATGDIGAAAERYAYALDLFSSMGNRVGIAQSLGAIARCAAIRGAITPAIRLLGSSSAMFRAIGATPPPDRDPTAAAASIGQQMPPAEFAEAWEAGQALSRADAIAEAFALAEDLAKEERSEPAPSGESVAIERPAAALPSPPAALGLTQREIEVLALLQDGLSDREIAEALSISERTAGNHVQHAMQKIGVSSRTAAAVFAVRHNLERPPSPNN